jgi:beta-lactam-binding protein with PASTA domain
LRGRLVSSPGVVALLLVVGAGAILVHGSGGRGATANAAPPKREVPYVVGLPILKAALELQLQGFRVSIPLSFSYGSVSPMPDVGTQSLPSGARATVGTAIMLTPRAVCCTLHTVSAPALSRMPQLIGRTGTEAIQTLIVKGLPWQVLVRPVNAARESILGGQVVAQWPAPGVRYAGGRETPARPPVITVDYAASNT